MQSMLEHHIGEPSRRCQSIERVDGVDCHIVVEFVESLASIKLTQFVSIVGSQFAVFVTRTRTKASRMFGQTAWQPSDSDGHTHYMADQTRIVEP